MKKTQRYSTQAPNPVTIKLNNQSYSVKEGTSLAAFLADIGLKSEGIAVAIHFEVVPKEKWVETILSDKLELMLIHAVSGG